MINMQYDCLLAASGMDSVDAAEFHGVDEEAVYMWISGDEEPPQFEIEKIERLDKLCRDAANHDICHVAKASHRHLDALAR